MYKINRNAKKQLEYNCLLNIITVKSFCATSLCKYITMCRISQFCDGLAICPGWTPPLAQG